MAGTFITILRISVTSKKLTNVYKVAQNDFTRKIKAFVTFTKIA